MEPDPEICKVCGERAGKHNYYGGQVCPSCRAFFRRAVQSNGFEGWRTFQPRTFYFQPSTQYFFNSRLFDHQLFNPQDETFLKQDRLYQGVGVRV